MSNINRLKKYHFIYKTTNLINGKFYIGMHSTSNLDDGYLGSGKRLRYSIGKYGIENFKLDVLEYCNSREELVEREKEIVDKVLLENTLCMNLKPGGNGGWKLINGIELQLKGAIAGGKAYSLRLKSDINFRKMISNMRSSELITQYKNGSRKRKRVLGWEGKHHSIETKNHLSSKAKLRLGLNTSQYGTCWIMNNECSKKIKKEELPYYLSIGWIKGRRMKYNVAPMM